ncbi:MAG: hypothetical protein DPW14_08655 [Planctomycetes bacterium]|nr:hypothetical protein [Planctomycetota bacterium]
MGPKAPFDEASCPWFDAFPLWGCVMLGRSTHQRHTAIASMAHVESAMSLSRLLKKYPQRFLLALGKT